MSEGIPSETEYCRGFFFGFVTKGFASSSHPEWANGEVATYSLQQIFLGFVYKGGSLLPKNATSGTQKPV